MNIFILDYNHRKNAQYHCDKHIVKMPLELAQILSTTHRVIDGQMFITKSKNNRNLKRWNHPNENLYLATHVNHPCNIWIRESIENYIFVYELFKSLGDEFEYRFGKKHLSLVKLLESLKEVPKGISKKSFTEPALAMPEYCKMEDVVSSYRKYYKEEKVHLFKWTGRDEPFFIKE